MSNEKDKNPKDKKSGNGELKYPKLVTDDLKPDPDVPGRYTYDPVEKPGQKLFELIDHDTFLNTEITIQWAVKDYIPCESTNLIFGASQSYKSFLAIDLGLCVASGIPWHGHKVKQGTVIYVCGEGHRGIRRRMSAWHGRNETSKETPPPFLISRKSAQLLNLEFIMDIQREIEEKLKEAPVLIIIDTLARNFGDGNENATEDMNTFVNNVDDHLKTPYEAAVLTIHHTGHTETQRARGAYTLHCSLDAEYRMDRIDDSVILHCTKMKDEDEPKDLFFDTIKTDTRFADEDGVTLKSLVLQLNEDGPPIKRDISERQREALEILNSMFEKSFDGAVSYQDWRKACYPKVMSKSRFFVVKNELLTQKTIEIRGDGLVRKGLNWEG